METDRTSTEKAERHHSETGSNMKTSRKEEKEAGKTKDNMEKKCSEDSERRTHMG